MQALIHPDLIVAAGFTDEQATIELIEDLYLIKHYLNIDSDIQFNKPKNILEALISCELYPSEKIFKKNLTNNNLSDVYSSKDITNLIHQIIEKSNDFTSDIEIEANEPEIEPEKNHPELTNNNAITSELFIISILNEISNNELTNIMGYSMDKNSEINIKALSVDFIDESGKSNDKKNYTNQIKLCCSMEELLLRIGSEKLYSTAKDINAYRMAVSTRAIEIIKESNTNTTIKPYIFGSQFFDSLNQLQCGPNQKFGSVCFDSVARIIAGQPKYDINPFRISTTSKEQRKRNNDLAFRTHITKSNEAIRLMFWATEDGEIEFANVGNKQDLHIYE